MNANVKILYIIDDKKIESSSSGSIIIYKGHYLLATAAHCLYDLKSEKAINNISIEISNKNNKYICDVESICLPRKWKYEQSLMYDYAFGKLSIDLEDLIDDPFVPLFDLKNSENKPTYVSGYPIKFFSKSLKLKKRELDFSLYKAENLIGMKTNLKYGASGGPWFLIDKNHYFQFSVTSAKIKSYKKTIWGPLWDSNTKKILDLFLKNTDTNYLNLY